eukprot:ctg_809.g392
MPSLTAAAVVAGEAPGGYLQAAGSGTSAATGGAGAPDAVGDRDAASSHGAAVDAAGRGVPRPTTLTPIGTPIMSSSALDALQESVPLARQVELDALVLLRIVGACERASGVGAGNPLDNAGSRSWGSRPGEWGAADASCAGQLLGWLDSDESSTAKRPVLHVTSAFTFPRTATARTGAPLGAHLQPQQRAQRLREASRLLRDVNREHQPVGWFYQADSGQLSSFINADWTEMQYQYQRCLKNAVCVVYDPLRKWSSATLDIRVVRLSAPFMQEYRRLLEGAATAAGGGGRGAAAQGQAFGRGGGRVVAGSTFTSEALRDLALCSQTMIEDVPFTLRSSALVEQYLAAYVAAGTRASAGRIHRRDAGARYGRADARTIAISAFPAQSRPHAGATGGVAAQAPRRQRAAHRCRTRAAARGQNAAVLEQHARAQSPRDHDGGARPGRVSARPGDERGRPLREGVWCALALSVNVGDARERGHGCAGGVEGRAAVDKARAGGGFESPLHLRRTGVVVAWPTVDWHASVAMQCMPQDVRPSNTRRRRRAAPTLSLDRVAAVHVRAVSRRHHRTDYPL